MAFTVTATATNGSDSVVIKIWVVTGGTETGGAFAAVVNSFAAGPWSFTPNASGSVVVAAVNNATNGTANQTPAANNATDDNTTTSSSGNVWDGHYTGTVTGSTAINVGTTFGGSSSYSYGIFEVEPSGTPAIDASTPAAIAGSSSSVTTASFTPPAGSVLAAIVTAYGSGTQVFGISDTSGLGLTWTQRQAASTGFTGSAAVYSTTIPGGGGTSGPPLGQREPPSRPSFIVARPGWRNAAHSR